MWRARRRLGVEMRRWTVLGMGGVMLSFAAAPAHAQLVDIDPVPPPSPSPRPQAIPDAVRWIAALQTNIGKDSKVTFGGLYFGGIETASAFALVDHTLDANWGLEAGYFYAVRSLENSANPTTHFARAGVTYKRDIGRFTFDDRLLYEAVINNQGREDGNRLRNRARLTYDVPARNDIKPRFYGYVEPILDDRFDGVARVNMAAGIGAKFAGAWLTDLYYLRQDTSGGSAGDLNAIVVQLIYQIGPAPR